MTLVALAMVGLLLLLPFVLARRALGAGGGARGWDLAYFACLGLGFMAVEIALVQKLLVYLGRPTFTLAVTLFVLLVSGAVGSRLLGRVDPRRPERLTLLLGVLVAAIALGWQSGLADLILRATAAFGPGGRALCAALLVAPLGLLLGAPLPAGVRAVAARAPTRIPWLWALNAACSVLGTVAASVVAIHGGISVTLGAGAALYAAALLLWRRVAAPVTTR